MSKNRKKSWKKHSDVKDVEEFLEDQRLDERLGGSVATKPDEELFYVDTTPVSKPAKPDQPETKRERRNRKLTCYLNLEPSSKVQPPTKPRRVRDPEERKPAAVRRIQQQRLARRHQQAVTDRLSSVVRSAKRVTSRFDFTDLKDVWAEEQAGDEKVHDDALPDPDLARYVAEYTKERRPKVPLHRYSKPSLLPAVEPPHPGASYNPAPLEHQDLLRQALEVEEKRKKEEDHIDRVLTKMLPTRENAPTEASVLAEMSQGLFDNSSEGEDDDIGTEAPPPMNPPVRAEDRKTKQKRRRELEQKRVQRAAKERKKERILANEVYRINTIKADMKRRAAISEERQKKRREREDAKLYGARRLSRYKYQEPDLAIKLTDELTDSLRLLNPEGNVLEDRFKSLQKRNIIEARQHQKKLRKYKPKKAMKREHRLFLEAETKKWANK